MLRITKLRIAAALTLVAFAIAMISPRSHASQASCIMPTTGTVSGLTLVNDINGCNNSLISVWSGASAPSGPQAGQFWYNTNINYVQEYDGASWISLWYVDSSNHLLTPQIGGGSVSASISSGSTTDLGSVPQPFVTINGTTTINSFGTSAPVGSVHFVLFNGVLALTYNATSMILPGAQTVTTQVGDLAEAMYLGSGNWRVLRYTLVSTPVKASPTTSDYLLIQDVAANNAPKKSLISALISLIGLSTPISAPNGGTGVASPTAHTIGVNEGASAQNNTGAGIIGQQLSSGGPGVDPSYQSGGWTLLNTMTASNSSALQDTTSLTLAYNEYEIVFEQIVPITNAVQCELQVNSGGFQSTNYITSALNFDSGAASAATTTFIPCSKAGQLSNSASYGISGRISLWGYNLGGIKTFTGVLSHFNSNGTNSTGVVVSGFWNSFSNFTGFQVIMSSGNISSGKIKVYGRL